MASHMKDFHLTILDQTMLRMYVRHLIIFPFPDVSRTNEAVQALRASLSVTLNQLPFLAGTIEPQDEYAHRLSLRYPDPIPEELIDRLFTSSHASAEDQDYDYDELKDAGFTPSKLSPDVFCPDLLKNHAGMDDSYAEGFISFKKKVPVPCFAAQVTFIRHGLVLSVYSNHAVVDGNGIAQVYQAWSACLRSQTQEHGLNPSIPTQTISGTEAASNAALDAQRVLFDDLLSSLASTDCPEVRFPGEPSRVSALHRTPYNTIAKILVFSASTVSKLTDALSAMTDTRMSNFTALITLLWTHITIARSSCLEGREIQDTRLCIAFDHRRNLGKDFEGSYLGNCATGTLVCQPLSEILSNRSDVVDAAHLAPLALNIVQSLSLITLDWLQSRLLLFSRTPSSYQLKMDIDVANGPDLFVTSWMHMGADSGWCIPGTPQEIPSAIRKPRSKVEGNIHILPRSKANDGDRAFEILLCLEEGEMGRLTDRLRREKWTESIIDA